MRAYRRPYVRQRLQEIERLAQERYQSTIAAEIAPTYSDDERLISNLLITAESFRNDRATRTASLFETAACRIKELMGANV